MRGPHLEGLPQDDRRKPFVGTALFSFEGAALDSEPLFLLRMGRPASRGVTYSHLENCIEKNFHVPNMRAGPW